MSVPPRAELSVRFTDGTTAGAELLDIELSGGRIPDYKSYASLEALCAEMTLPNDLAAQDLLSSLSKLETVATYTGLLALLFKRNPRRDYVQIEIRRVTPGRYY